MDTLLNREKKEHLSGLYSCSWFIFVFIGRQSEVGAWRCVCFEVCHWFTYARWAFSSTWKAWLILRSIKIIFFNFNIVPHLLSAFTGEWVVLKFCEQTFGSVVSFSHTPDWHSRRSPRFCLSLKTPQIPMPWSTPGILWNRLDPGRAKLNPSGVNVALSNSTDSSRTSQSTSFISCRLDLFCLLWETDKQIIWSMSLQTNHYKIIKYTMYCILIYSNNRTTSSA